jgi:hypothetical protein
MYKDAIEYLAGHLSVDPNNVSLRYAAISATSLYPGYFSINPGTPLTQFKLAAWKAFASVLYLHDAFPKDPEAQAQIKVLESTLNLHLTYIQGTNIFH